VFVCLPSVFPLHCFFLFSFFSLFFLFSVALFSFCYFFLFFLSCFFCLFFFLTLVKFQGQGIYQAILRHVSKSYSDRADFLCLRTQNPVVFKVLQNVFGDAVYPILKEPDEDIRKLGASIAERLQMKDYIVEKLVGRNVYSPHVSAAVSAGDSDTSKKMREYLSANGADAVLFLVRL